MGVCVVGGWGDRVINILSYVHRFVFIGGGAFVCVSVGVSRFCACEGGGRFVWYNRYRDCPW